MSQQQKDLHPKECEVNENQKKSKLFKLKLKAIKVMQLHRFLGQRGYFNTGWMNCIHVTTYR